MLQLHVLLHCIVLFCFEFCLASYYCKTTMIKSRLCMQIFHDISVTVVYAGTSSINACASTGLSGAQGLQNLPRSPWNRRKSTRDSHCSSPPQSWPSHPIPHLWPQKNPGPTSGWSAVMACGIHDDVGIREAHVTTWRNAAYCFHIAIPKVLTILAQFPSTRLYNYKVVVQKQKHGYTVMSSDVMWYGVVRVVHPMSMVVQHFL